MMQSRSGTLFDLGLDGLGFIRDAEDGRAWAFRCERVGLTTSPQELPKLEGFPVSFDVGSEGRIVALRLEAVNTMKASH